jgi:hypothetical protein
LMHFHEQVFLFAFRPIDQSLAIGGLFNQAIFPSPTSKLDSDASRISLSVGLLVLPLQSFTNGFKFVIRARR